MCLLESTSLKKQVMSSPLKYHDEGKLENQMDWFKPSSNSAAATSSLTPVTSSLAHPTHNAWLNIQTKNGYGTNTWQAILKRHWSVLCCKYIQFYPIDKWCYLSNQPSPFSWWTGRMTIAWDDSCWKNHCCFGLHAEKHHVTDQGGNSFSLSMALEVHLQHIIKGLIQLPLKLIGVCPLNSMRVAPGLYF